MSERGDLEQGSMQHVGSLRGSPDQENCIIMRRSQEVSEEAGYGIGNLGWKASLKGKGQP